MSFDEAQLIDADKFQLLTKHHPPGADRLSLRGPK